MAFVIFPYSWQYWKHILTKTIIYIEIYNMLWITKYIHMLHLKRVLRFWKVLPDPASSAETYDGLLEDDDALEDASEDRENIFSWGNGTLNRRFAGAEPGKGEEFVGSSILGEGRRAPLVTVGGVEARVGTDGDCVRDGFRTWSVLAVIRASLGVRCTLALPWDPSETYYTLFITYTCRVFHKKRSIFMTWKTTK